MTELLHDPDVHRLGKNSPKPPRLHVARYVDVERATRTVPDVVDNSQGRSIALAMYLNDKEGDCTIAAAANTLRVNSRGELVLLDPAVQAGYVAVTGSEGAAYDPATGANDNGAAELDVLDLWTDPGIGGDKLLGHAGVNMRDPSEVKVTCWLFGSVYIGIALSVAQQRQDVWDAASGPTGAPGSWGGHAVPIFDLGPGNANYLGTWGKYKQFTDAFVAEYADEGHAVLTRSWLDANQGNPLLDVSALTAEMARLRPEKLEEGRPA